MPLPNCDHNLVGSKHRFYYGKVYSIISSYLELKWGAKLDR